MMEKLELALSKAQALESRVHAQGFVEQIRQRKAENEGATSQPSAEKSELESMVETTDAPRSLDPIPCKPLLFDLAILSCAFPDLKSRIPQTKRWGFW
jgi:hypothetical protein